MNGVLDYRYLQNDQFLPLLFAVPGTVLRTADYACEQKEVPILMELTF